MTTYTYNYNFFILSGSDLDQAIVLAKKIESKDEQEHKIDLSTVRKRPREESIVQSTPESGSHVHTPSSEYKGTPKSIKELKSKYEKDLAKVTLSDKKMWCKHIVEKVQKMRVHSQQLQAEEQEQEQPQNDSPEVFDDDFNAWIEDVAKED